MNKPQKGIKKPASENTVFKNMMLTVFAVATVFFLKNVIAKSWPSAIIIGLCLAIFSITIFTLKKRNANARTQQLTVCLGIAVLVFCISLNSGSYYSDDFPLYLSVIALSGLYLVPQYTLIQAALIDVLLIAAYFIHPEKAESFSQYMMCVGIFTVGAFCLYMVIKRGRAYIEIGEARAEEAERLLAELKNAGEELQTNCSTSVARISKLEEANFLLKASTHELKAGSEGITRGTIEVSETFDDVQSKMHTTEKQVEQLNTEVQKVEQSLSENKKNMKEMTNGIESLKSTVESATEVFRALEEQISEITKVTEQLTSIASSTNMLALNASIEAARAGQAGAGFAVVATNVQSLAEDSNKCSNQVVNVVNTMHLRIEETSRQLSDSTQAINASITAMKDFQEGFEQLTAQFSSLYDNIEEQNTNVHEMDGIFENLKYKINEMAASSEANQTSVDAITDAIAVYKENIDMVVNDNKVINEISVAMLELSQTELDLVD